MYSLNPIESMLRYFDMLSSEWVKFHGKSAYSWNCVEQFKVSLTKQIPHNNQKPAQQFREFEFYISYYF